MGLTKAQVESLQELGFSYHDIAQVAKVPTPVIIQIGMYGKQPDQQLDFDFDAFAKTKAKKEKEEKKPIELTDGK